MHRRQAGVALAVIVWFLAAMSLLLAGIAMQARTDIRLTQLHLSRAKVEAAADGGIQLALAAALLDQQTGDLDPARPFRSVHSLGSVEVNVLLQPLGGLVDLNLAPEQLLFRLFSTLEGVEEDRALALARSVVEWRSPKVAALSGAPGAEGDTGQGARFETIEDLLQVPGISRREFDALRDAIYVSQQGQSGVDWASAPVTVLQALGDLDREAARELADARADSEEYAAVAPAEIDLSFQERRGLSGYRADAQVVLDGSVFLRRRWVVRGSPGADGLPWQFVRTEPVRVAGRGGREGGSLNGAAHAGR